MLWSKQPDAPKEILNWRLWYGVFVFGLMGAARGLDEGLIGTSASQPSFQRIFGLEDGALSESAQADRLGNIAAMVQMGSILGALIAFVITDKIGRLWATRQLCALWVIGITMFLCSATNGSLGLVYAGRFIAGMGIGQTTVVAPTYLAEVAPKHVRGLAVCMFSGSVYLGIMLAYFASWGSSIHISDDTVNQWVIPNLLHIYFAALIFILSFFAVESPRWLVKVHKSDQAALKLSKLRKLPVDHWYFAMMGITGQQEGLFATVIFGIVKFCSALICAFFLIDFVGRKKALMTGISLQFVAMLYMAIFLFIDTSVSEEGAPQSASEKSAAKGAIAMIYISGFGWAMGWNSIQYLINSEIYPLRLRAIGGSFAMTFHFVNQYGNSKAVPKMFISMTTAGTMIFFALITLIGLIWAWFFVPELAGKSLESVDAVFELPWYLIGRKGKELTKDQGGAVETFGQEKANMGMVEDVSEGERKV